MTARPADGLGGNGNGNNSNDNGQRPHQGWLILAVVLIVLIGALGVAGLLLGVGAQGDANQAVEEVGQLRDDLPGMIQQELEAYFTTMAPPPTGEPTTTVWEEFTVEQEDEIVAIFESVADDVIRQYLEDHGFAPAADDECECDDLIVVQFVIPDVVRAADGRLGDLFIGLDACYRVIWRGFEAYPEVPVVPPSTTTTQPPPPPPVSTSPPTSPPPTLPPPTQPPPTQPPTTEAPNMCPVISGIRVVELNNGWRLTALASDADGDTLRYLWSNGGEGRRITVRPSVTTTYTVWVTDGVCTVSAGRTITVTPPTTTTTQAPPPTTSPPTTTPPTTSPPTTTPPTTTPPTTSPPTTCPSGSCEPPPDPPG